MTVMAYACRAQTVIPGGKFWVYFPKGNGSTVIPTVPAGWTWRFPAFTGDNQEWYRQWTWEIQVKANETPGAFQIAIPGTSPVEYIDVTVVAAPGARDIRYANTPNQSSIQGWLNAGYDIWLAPRLYEWDTFLEVPDGASIRSSGAMIVRKSSGETGIQQRLFKPLGAMTLEGLVLTHDDSIDDVFESCTYIHNFPAPTSGNVTIRNVTLRRGALFGQSAIADGGLIEHCKFEQGSGGNMQNNSVWLNNDFYGLLHVGEHTMLNNSADKCLVASQRFHHTKRGIVIQNHSAFGNVFLDIYMDGIRGGEGMGAQECLALENNGNTAGATIRDNAFIDFKILNCSGPGISFFGGGMQDNIFWNCDVHTDSHAMQIREFGTNGINGPNEFHNCEMTGNLLLTGNIGQNTFDIRFIESELKHGTDGPFIASYQFLQKHYPIYSDAEAQAAGAQTWSNSAIVLRSGGILKVESLTPTVVQTTNATITSLCKILLQEGISAYIEATVYGVGTSTRAMLRSAIKAHRTTGFGATVDNVESVIVDSIVLDVNMTADASGNDVRILVQGPAAETMTWKLVDIRVKEF